MQFLAERRADVVGRGNRFILVGVSEAMMTLLRRTGIVEHLDPADLYPATPEVFGPLREAVTDAEQWIETHRSTEHRTDR